MVRQQRTKGFALLELMVTVFVLGVLTLAAVMIPSYSENRFYVFPDQYLRIQSESLLTGESRIYDDDFNENLPEIRFNGNGNVNQARTILFEHKGSFREIIVELGGGRLVFR